MKNINKINEYMLKKRSSIIPDTNDFCEEQNRVNPNVVFGALANLETWAYKVDLELVEDFLNMSENTFINKYYNPLIDTIKHLKGDDVSHDHFVFQNFPDSCKKIPLKELSEMRFARYYTVFIDKVFGTDLTSSVMDGKKPDYIDRPSLDNKNLTSIKKAKIEDFYELNKNLIGSKSAMSSLDKEIVAFSIHNKKIPNDKILPTEIPYKETLALMLKYDMEEKLGLNIEFASYKDFKRSLAILSDEDPSKKNIRLRKFSTEEKKYLLKKLETATKKNPDIVKNQMYADRRFVYHLNQYWKMSRYENIIPETKKIFDMIQSKEKMITEETVKGEAIKNKNSKELLESLKKNPGELFRRLYFLLEHAKDENEIKEIIDTAERSAFQVQNNILLSVRSEVLSSNEPNFIKVAFPHGNTREAYPYENHRKPLDDSTIKRIDKICCDALISRLSTKHNFTDKKIYISEDMKRCPVPFGAKDESSSTRTLTKGTRFYVDGLKREKDIDEQILEFDKKKKEDFLRLFVYKKIKHGGFVDLSASFLDKDCQLVEQCSWTNLKTDETRKPLAVHSGDGYDCRNGLSEFIDIDLSKLEKYSKTRGIEYVAMQVHSYNGIPFKDMDQCFAGVMKCDDMIKSKVPSNERYKIFDPKLVKDKIDLTGNEIVSIPFLYNVRTREIVVGDIALKHPYREIKDDLEGSVKDLSKEKLLEYAKRCNISEKAVIGLPTLESCHSVVAHAARNIINNNYPKLYDLYAMAAIGGGAKLENFVTSPKDADISFSWDGTITPYDRDIITKEFMTIEKECLEKAMIDQEKIEKMYENIETGYNMDMMTVLENPDVLKQVLNELKGQQKPELDER